LYLVDALLNETSGFFVFKRLLRLLEVSEKQSVVQVLVFAPVECETGPIVPELESIHGRETLNCKEAELRVHMILDVFLLRE
jgi:hypothetical protein